MVRNEHEIVLDAPAGVVFAWVADVAAWRRWRPSEGQLERATAGPVGVGTTWQASGRVMDEQITVAVEITAYEPDVRFGIKVSGSIQAVQTFTFEPVAGETRLRVTLDLANPDLAEPARQQWDADLRRLKHLLEAEAKSTSLGVGQCGSQGVRFGPRGGAVPADQQQGRRGDAGCLGGVKDSARRERQLLIEGRLALTALLSECTII